MRHPYLLPYQPLQQIEWIETETNGNERKHMMELLIKIYRIIIMP